MKVHRSWKVPDGIPDNSYCLLECGLQVLSQTCWALSPTCSVHVTCASCYLCIGCLFVDLSRLYTPDGISHIFLLPKKNESFLNHGFLLGNRDLMYSQ